MSFIPLVRESLGAGWNEEAIHNITRIGQFLGQRIGNSTDDTTQHLYHAAYVSLPLEKQGRRSWSSQSGYDLTTSHRLTNAF